jgi:hypothetical protein
MPNTYKLIASVTVGSGGAVEIDFTSIPSTYTDLILKISGRSTAASSISTGVLYINTDTTNGSWRNLAGDGSSAFSTNASGYIDGTYFPAATSTSSTFGNAEFYFSNYAGSTAKSISIDGVTENSATLAYVNMRAILWNNTAAINRITINAGGGSNFVQYSTAYLYGINKS